MTNLKLGPLLKRGVKEIIVEQELIKLLESGKCLRLKQGFDPSSPDIHLGHVAGLRKLRQFQDLGHKVILIVGDWTARIGDPSGQSVTRPMLSPQEVEYNAQTYMEQFFKVVDKSRADIRWQSEWYGKFTLDEVIKLTSKFTVAQLLAREDFSNRYSSGNPISLTELLYPLLQGYDSVVVEADVEFGGIDQKFNCLLGRGLQQSMGQPSQQVFLVPLLIGTDGSQKMSKSLNNHIGIYEAPQEMYGKVMSIPDYLIIDYFELVTDVQDEEIAAFKEQMNTLSVNPMNFKKRLAYEITSQFHDKQAAVEAEEQFTKVFQEKQMPNDILEYAFIAKHAQGELYEVDIAPTLLQKKLVKSNSELKRLLAQGAIELNGKKVSRNIMNAPDNSILRIGKRCFIRMAINRTFEGG